MRRIEVDTDEQAGLEADRSLDTGRHSAVFMS